MNRLPRPILHTTLFVCLCLGAAGAVQAHGELSPVDDLTAHIGDYEKEVADMRSTVDSIVADYAAGEAVADRVDALVETWEEVEFHEAVETHAMPLYPSIWIALGGLREAVDESGADADVQQWQRRLEQALYEGVGALKLAATQQDDESDTAETAAHGHGAAADERPTITIIKDNLQSVVDTYRDGDSETAKSLLHQTYMERFEGIEGDLIERDADLVTDLEKDFNATLPLLMEKQASADDLAAEVEKMNVKLDRAQTLLDDAAKDQSSVF